MGCDGNGSIEEVKICTRCDHSISVADTSTVYEGLLSLSRQNASITPGESSYLSSDLVKETATLDEEIRRHEETLAALKLRREKKRLIENVSSSLSAPIRTLPVEVLIKIFVQCCRSKSRRNERPNRFEAGGRLQTLVLAGVCSYWREVTVTTPIIWGDLSLCVPVDGMRVTPIINLLDLYLTRSGNAALDIYLDCPDYGDDPFKEDNKEEVSRILDLLNTHSSRYRSLIVDDLILEHFTGYNLPSSSLAELKIKATEYTGSALFRNFEDCLSLRRISLTLEPESISLPWYQITELELGSGCRKDLVFVHEKAPSVSSIIFVGLFSGPRYLDYPKLTMTQLESLCFRKVISDSVYERSDHLEELNIILCHMDCPRLTHLSVHSHPKYRDAWPLESFKTFFRACPKLAALELEDLLVDSGFIIGCLPYLQNVTSLSILGRTSRVPKAKNPDVEVVDEDLITALTFIDENSLEYDSDTTPAPNLLPSLQSLHLRGRSFTVNKVFVDFLASRRGSSASVAHLLEVKLEFKDTEFVLSDNDHDRLRQMCSDGLRVFDCGYMLDGYKRPFLAPRTWLV